MNVTIDNVSPQIQYLGNWGLSSADDPTASGYLMNSFHATNGQGDSASLTFNGTAVTVYGAFRENHGNYSSQIDDLPPQYASGKATPYQYQQVLFHARSLAADKEHRVILTNLPNSTTPRPAGRVQYYLDIDYIVIETPTEEPVYTTIFDDTSPAFTYSGSGWQSLIFGNYYNLTNHLTNTPGDSFDFSFNGTAVQIFAGVNEDHGSYSVVLDGGLAKVYNGHQDYLFSNTSRLTQGPHRLSITNLGSTIANRTILDFDYAIVNSSWALGAGNTTGTNTTLPSGSTDLGGTNPDSGGASSSPSLPSIIGGAVGGGVALAIIAALLWFCIYKRHRRRVSSTPHHHAVDLTGNNGGQGILNDNTDSHENIGLVEPFRPMMQRKGTSNGSSPMRSLSSLNIPNMPLLHSGTQGSRSSASTATISGIGRSPDSHVGGRGGPFQHHSPPGSHATNSQGGLSPDQDRLHNHSTLSPSDAMASSLSQTNTNTGTGTNVSFPTPSPAQNGAGTNGTLPLGSLSKAAIALPYTARPPRSSFLAHQQPRPQISAQEGISPSSLDRSLGGVPTSLGVHSPPRMSVVGRETDLGPIPLEDYEGLLPPVYEQATEPLPGQRPAAGNELR